MSESRTALERPFHITDLTLAAILILIFVTTIAGCGYTFAAGGADAPSRFERVAVSLVENHTPDPTLVSACTSALVDNLSTRGRVTTARGEADLVVEGVVTDVGERAAAVGDRVEGARPVEVEVAVEIELIGLLRDGRRVRSRAVRGVGYYMRDPSLPALEAGRRAALDDACVEAMGLGVQILFSSIDPVDTQPEPEPGEANGTR